MRILAIDPGKTGAIAEYSNGKVQIFDMPKDPGISQFIYGKENTIAYIEQIQARETDKIHVSSSMKLMKNYGICLGVLYVYDYHVKIVKSSVWMSGFVKAGLSYTQRKSELYKIAKKIFPKIKIKKSQADALCLLAYGMAQEVVELP